MWVLVIMRGVDPAPGVRPGLGVEVELVAVTLSAKPQGVAQAGDPDDQVVGGAQHQMLHEVTVLVGQQLGAGAVVHEDQRAQADAAKPGSADAQDPAEPVALQPRRAPEPAMPDQARLGPGGSSMTPGPPRCRRPYLPAFQTSAAAVTPSASVHVPLQGG